MSWHGEAEVRFPKKAALSVPKNSDQCISARSNVTIVAPR